MGEDYDGYDDHLGHFGVFVIGFMGVLCYGLAVLNRDMEDKRDHDRQKPTAKKNAR